MLDAESMPSKSTLGAHQPATVLRNVSYSTIGQRASVNGVVRIGVLFGFSDPLLVTGGEEDVEADGGHKKDEEEQGGKEVPEPGPDGELKTVFPIDAEELGIVNGEQDCHQADADLAFTLGG